MTPSRRIPNHPDVDSWEEAGGPGQQAGRRDLLERRDPAALRLREPVLELRRPAPSPPPTVQTTKYNTRYAILERIRIMHILYSPNAKRTALYARLYYRPCMLALYYFV